jgi:soluble lytic murein transglycosylase
MKRILCALLLLFPLSAVFCATPDDRILAARDAFRVGDAPKLARQLDAVRGHELEPWVEYWQLSLRLADADAAEPRNFLARYDGSYLAEKLRGEWLKTLGKRKQWDIFDAEYAKLVQPDQEVLCYALQSRLRLPDPSALEEARPLWFSAPELAEPCMPLMEQLIAGGRISADDVWQRLRRQLEAKKLAAAKLTAGYLPTSQAPGARLIDAVADKPVRHLALLPPGFAARRLEREMALFAVQRMARSDPLQAATQWERIKDKFSDADRAYIYGQLGWQGALRHLPEATAWYALAGNAPLSEEQLAWKARAALRALDWKMVHEAIEQMPAQMAVQPDWVYWLGRAHAALGRHDEARALYKRIAGQPNFYGNLADDELGQPITVPPKGSRPTAEEVKAAADNPGIRRALALFRIDMRIEAIREWIWTLRGMDDRMLLAIAELAQKHEIFDRAINTADKTLAQHDYGLRYLAPYREHIEPKARELQLDQGWVYGLMRQESRFITNAKSVVGAKGLMQLMPKTAQWVARKIGLKDYHPGRVQDTDVNVTLGTNYMKMVLDDLDNHPVLASAAYNAGPGRARKWRDVKPIEGAIYAETIPFNETRDYVKKVMSNSVYYSALFDGKPQSLKSRLGTIGPRGSNDAAKAEDLP